MRTAPSAMNPANGIVRNNCFVICYLSHIFQS